MGLLSNVGRRATRSRGDRPFLRMFSRGRSSALAFDDQLPCAAHEARSGVSAPPMFHRFPSKVPFLSLCRRLLFHGSSKAALGGVQRRVNLDCRQLVANLCISTSCFTKTIGLEPGDGRPPKDGGVRFKRATLPDDPSEEACRHFAEVRASVPSTYPVLRAMFGVATSCLRTWSSCNPSSPNSPAERSSQATLGRRR